jgi:hypothetical protein
LLDTMFAPDPIENGRELQASGWGPLLPVRQTGRLKVTPASPYDWRMSRRARAGGGVLEPRFRRAVAGDSVLTA